MKLLRERLLPAAVLLLGLVLLGLTLGGMFLGGMLLASCNFEAKPDWDAFDAATEGILQVRTCYPGPDESQVVEYFAIADGERLKPCDPFVADDMTIYYVPHQCFESYIDRDKNMVLNRLNYVAVTDEEGTRLETPPIAQDIFEQVAHLEHDLFGIKLFALEDEWFVYVELNVNWWLPCDLYYYNATEKKLVELVEFNNKEVQGLHILSRDRLHGLQ